MANKSYPIQIGKLQSNIQLPVDTASPLGPRSKAGRISQRASRKKQVLVLNSHSLSDYQRCPKRYEFNNIIQIETQQTKAVYLLGTYWGKMLEIYYRYKISIKDKYPIQKQLERMSVLVSRLRKCADNEDNGFDDETRNLLATRIVAYYKRYLNEDWEPLGVEVGFSIILYEDKYTIFIYEGRPDRILRIKDPFNPGRRVICVSDDKTRGRNEDLIDYNNQVNGYLVAAKTNWFVYNYMGKQKDTQKAFDRQLVHRSDIALEKWKQTTIKWYFRILADRNREEFLESMQCPGEYSACEFLPLCASKDEREYNAVMNAKFKKRPEARKSW
jgi:hypothetical protein